MPNHRAPRRRASRATPEEREAMVRGAVAPGGRRTATEPARARRVTWSAAFGGSALMIAAVGAVSLSQPAPPAAAQTAFTQTVSGQHEPSDSLYSRAVPRVSRGGDRPLLAQTDRLETAAEERVEARDAQLATAADQARSYAKDLASVTWDLPTSGFHISTWFGEGGYYWSSGYHTGIDFATACGTPTIAVADGVVTQSGWDGPYGNQVRLTLSNGDQVWYNHMTEIKTQVGAHLSKGDEVGLVGETGNAFGCHLHFEYRLKSDLDTAVDPRPFFAAHGITLH